MLRPVSLLPALAAVVTVLAGLGVSVPAPAAAADRHRAEDPTPLSVSIDDLSPSTIPRAGPIRVSGSVTNRDDGVWRAIKLYAFISGAPMTTSEQITEAAQTPETTEVGSRIIDLGSPRTQATIDTLEPGASTSFSLLIPRKDITVTAAGVYWFGVHALGEGPEGRIDGADGRARTFLPLVPPHPARKVQTALVVSVRRDVQHQADGRIDDVASWTTSLSPGGRLYSAATLGIDAGSHAVTWVVDPAVIDAAQQLAAGNPARSLDPTVGPREGDDDADPSDDASAPDGADPESPSTDPSDDDPGEGGDEPDEETLAAASAASAWLDRIHSALEGDEILLLPYGDTDVAAAAAHDPATYRTARDRSGTTLAPWGLPATPVVASATDFLPVGAMRLADDGTTILASDTTIGPGAPTVSTVAGRRVVVTSAATATGGPGPDDRLAPVALRQRILSDAAVHLLSGAAEPLVVQLPRAIRPAATTGLFTRLFGGLDVDWLDLTGVSTVAARTPAEVPESQLVYPAAEEQRELTAFDFTGADDLTRSGGILQNLLTLNDQVGKSIADEALTNIGYADRSHATRARGAAGRSRLWVEQRLHSVTVEAPKAVILASGHGRFSAAITNRLDQPVSVRLTADADPPLRVAVPRRTYDVAAGARTSVLLNAANPGLGVRTVTLRLTDTDGAPLGSSDSLPMRSNRVSNVIWLIIGIGVALLFGAIAVRLARRIRAARG